MKNTLAFSIIYKGKQMPVTFDPTGNENEGDYTVHFEHGPYILQLKEDNEGASRWFEKNTDLESDFSREIGQEIEKSRPPLDNK